MKAKWKKLFEFLYENGYRYIARNEKNSMFRACAYIHEPKVEGGYLDENSGFKYKVYLESDEDRCTTKNTKYCIDLNFIYDSCNKFPVECGEMKEISELLAYEEDSDAVNHPKHYQLPSGRESVDVMREILTDEEFRGWCKGNALKYIFREGKKDDAVQDIKKAGKFLEFLTEEKQCLDC